MPLYHLHVSTGSRVNGASAKAKAEYIQREGKYERQDDRCIHRESGNMPGWAEDKPTSYWQAADEHERKNGRLYKEVEVSLPRELDEEKRLELARDFARDLTQDENLPYTLAVHEGRGEDGRAHNPHAHVMISERQNDGVERDEKQWFSRFNRDEPDRGGAEKTMNLRSKEWLEDTRENWSREVNRAYEEEGRRERIDHRSFRDQDIERVPQRHLGPNVMAMEERGIETERGHEFERINQLNDRHEREREQVREYQREIEQSTSRTHELERDVADHERSRSYGRSR